MRKSLLKQTPFLGALRKPMQDLRWTKCIELKSDYVKNKMFIWRKKVVLFNKSLNYQTTLVFICSTIIFPTKLITNISNFQYVLWHELISSTVQIISIFLYSKVTWIPAKSCMIVEMEQIHKHRCIRWLCITSALLDASAQSTGNLHEILVKFHVIATTAESSWLTRRTGSRYFPAYTADNSR